MFKLNVFNKITWLKFKELKIVLNIICRKKDLKNIVCCIIQCEFKF